MKRVFKTSAVWVILSVCLQSVFGQVRTTYPLTDWSGIPLKNVDPNSLYSYGWQQNRFNWFLNDPNPQNNYFCFYNQINGVNKLKSPFTGSNDLSSLAPLYTNPDMYWEDGWELIKQDFGIYNYDNLSNNNYNACSDLSTNGPNVQPTPSALSYFILYNKFTGVLRVLGYYPTTNDNNFVQVSLSFNKTLSVSGLFGNYDGTGQTLDKNTARTIVQTVASLPQGSEFSFFFADFQTAYDPCTPFFASELIVEFSFVTQGSVNLYGVSQSLGGQGSDPSTYLASVWTTDGSTVGGGIVTYKTVDDLTAGLTAAASIETPSDNSVQSDLSTLPSVLEAASSVASLFPEGDAASKALEAVSKVTDLFSSQIGDGTNNMASTVTSAIALTGTLDIAGDILQHNLAVPGSTAANQDAPNEFNANPNVDYPLYNEALGTFALLKTPVVNYYDLQVPPTTSTFLGFPYVTDAGSRTVAFQFPVNQDNLKFTFNPAIEVIRYEIEAALEITRYWYKNGFTVYPSTISNLITLSDGNDIGNKVINGDLYQQSTVYITPYASLECFENIIAEIDYAQYNGSETEISGPYYNTSPANDQFVANLKLIVKMEFEQKNRNGKNNASVLLTMYPLTLNAVGTKPTPLLSNNAPFNGDGGIPDDLTLGSQNIDPSQTIYAFEEIDITGDVTATNNNVNLVAGQNIIMSGQGSLTGNFILSIGTPPSVCLQNLTALDNTNFNFSNYCNNNISTIPYLANIPTRREVTATASATPTSAKTPILKSSVQAAPNPANGKTTFYVKIPGAGATSLYITNPLGEKVRDILVNQTLETGLYQYEADLSNLQEGVYFYTFGFNGATETHRLVVLK